MTSHSREAATFVAAVAVAALAIGRPAFAQSCPAVLTQATRLVLVTAPSMNDTVASLRRFQRTGPRESWHPVDDAEPAVIGRGGMGWSRFFSQLARRGEPIKIEGDRRAPAGVYAIGPTFGVTPSSRSKHVLVSPDTVCVDDPASPRYNRIVSRSQIGPHVHVENMSRAMPMYRRGLVVQYPTDAARRAGSCIFIHVWRSSTTGTSGCVAMPEQRVEALQAFSADGAAVLAILPRGALARLAGCLPDG